MATAVADAYNGSFTYANADGDCAERNTRTANAYRGGPISRGNAQSTDR